MNRLATTRRDGDWSAMLEFTNFYLIPGLVLGSINALGRIDDLRPRPGARVPILFAVTGLRVCPARSFQPDFGPAFVAAVDAFEY